MDNSLFKSLAITFVVIVFAFFLHFFLVLEEQFLEILLKSYFINFVMASFIFSVIYKFKQTKPDLLGFYFLGGSFFKFIVFFAIFLPFFKEDGDLSSQEFFTFFIPYIIVLVVEVSLLIKVLNKES